MAVVQPEAPIEDDFAELDELEIIESSELKLSGAYHSYYYYAREDLEGETDS
jgi:hypothetical protein